MVLLPSLAAVRMAVRELVSLDWEHVAATAARAMARGPVSKFQPCLPEAVEEQLLVERLLDVEGTREFLRPRT